jgi:hypothetical protein
VIRIKQALGDMAWMVRGANQFIQPHMLPAGPGAAEIDTE